VSTRWEPDG